jgi:hypothetical protein
MFQYKTILENLFTSSVSSKNKEQQTRNNKPLACRREKQKKQKF